MPGHPQLFSLLPFVKIATYNANSLSLNPKSRLGIWRRDNIKKNIQHLAKNNDIICIQETHLAYANEHTLSGLLRNWGIVFNNFNKSSNGTLIALSPRILDNYDIFDLNLGKAAKGRLQVLRLTPKNPKRHLPLQIVNCYFPSGSTDNKKSPLFDLLLTPDLISSSPKHSYFVGDFNFIESKSDTTSCSEGHLLGSKALAKWTDIRRKYNLKEISQPNHTHFSSLSPEGTSTRLDRIYASFSDADLTLYTPTAYLPNLPHSPTNRLPVHNKAKAMKGLSLSSDHFAVALNFISTSPNNKRDYNLPHWVPNTAEFPVFFFKEWGKTMSDEDHPYRKRKLFREAACKAGAAILAAPPEVKQANSLSALSMAISFFRLNTQNKPDYDKINAMANKNPYLKVTMGLDGKVSYKAISTLINSILDKSFHKAQCDYLDVFTDEEGDTGLPPPLVTKRFSTPFGRPFPRKETHSASSETLTAT